MTTPRDFAPLRDEPPEEGGSFVKRLHERFGEGVDPDIHLQSPEDSEEGQGAGALREAAGDGPDSSESSTSRGLYSKLSEQVSVGRRYQVQHEIARGGMGAIIRIWDEDLRRNLAMKVMHGSGDDARRVDPEKLGRFLEEAQITGQLDHPGVVPVHDLGIDSSGRCYFTMRLVRGRELREILDLTREGKEGWTPTRALGLILKVCEAMAYAHSKGVVHRDLKPSNVMVGRFGEVYVMDWGLARVVGKKYAQDTRPRHAPEDASGVSLVRTVRREESRANPDSPLVTMDGDVVGTPSFMAVEQAQGRLDAVGPRSDVYSLGAILYYMLSGRSPYVEPGERISPHTVLNRVLAGPPVPVSKYAKDAPAELVAICEKAMARHAQDRYAGMLQVADDIQAFLENRVVHAYEGGAVAEFRKWVFRNRGMAAATAALVLLTIASAFGFAWQKGQQVNALNAEKAETALARERAEQNADLARSREQEARDNLGLALERKAEADENARIAERNAELARRSSYKANIVAADFSLRLNDVKEARKRLDACDPDLRGWEWRHLDLKGDPALATAGPYGPVEDVAFLPDSRRFLSLSRSGRLRVHDVAGGDEIGEGIQASGLSILRGQRPVFDVTRDGRSVAVTTGTKKIRIYDLESGAELLQIDAAADVRGHGSEVTSLDFSPSGRKLASGGEDGSVIVWDARRGTIEKRFPGHQGAVTALAWDGFGERLVSASRDKTLRVWDLESERELLALLGHQDVVTDVAWSYEGERIASSSADRTVILWDARTGRLDKSLLGHEAAVTCVDFHPEGKLVVTGSADATVRLWEPETRAFRILRGHEEAVRSVAFSPDGDLVVSGAEDRLVKLWDARGEPSSSLVVEHQSAADSVFGKAHSDLSDPQHESVAVHPGGVLFAVGEGDHTIAIWDGHSGLLRDLLRGHGGAVTALEYSPDGRYLLSGSYDKTARIWEVESGRVVHVLGGHGKWVGAVAWAPDGSWCVTGAADRLIRIWDTGSGELLETLPGHDKSNGFVNGLAVHPDGERIVSCARDQSVLVWRRGQQAPIATLTGHTRPVSTLALGPGGRLLLSAGLDATARMWDLETGATLFVARGHDQQIDDVSFHPDGTRFATASTDGSVRIWDALSGDPLLAIEEPDRRISGVAFAPDGARLLSVSDRSVRFWETGGVSERIARWSAARARQRVVVERVGELFDRYFYLGDVLLRIENDPDQVPETKAWAQRLARIRGDDPWRLDATTRKVVARPQATPEEIDLALRRARAACELDPRNGHLQCTLGLAQYRAERFEEAIETLRLAQATNRQGRPERSDFDFTPAQASVLRAALAMALFRQGQVAEAAAELEGLRQEVASDVVLQENAVLASMLEEAEALIGSSTGAQKS